MGWSEINDLAFPDDFIPNFEAVSLEFNNEISFPFSTNWFGLVLTPSTSYG